MCSLKPVLCTFALTFYSVICLQTEIPNLIPDSGSWYPNGKCPSGTFVKAVRLPSAEIKGLSASSGRMSVEIDPVGYSDETGLRDLEIFCSNPGDFDRSFPTSSEYSLEGNFSLLTCPGNMHATGFKLYYGKKQGGIKSRIWYLGAHQFANEIANNFLMFCGRSLNIWEDPEVYYGQIEGSRPNPAKSGDCGRSDPEAYDWKVMCQLFTNTRIWNTPDELTPTSARSVELGCCSTENVVCPGGKAGYTDLEQCYNANGQTPSDCTFERKVGLSYPDDTWSIFRPVQKAKAVAQRQLDIASQQKLGFTLNNVGPIILNNFRNIDGFNTSSKVETNAEEKSYGNISFSVPAGVNAQVRQLIGTCEGNIYAVKTDVFEILFTDSTGRIVQKLSGAFPLNPRNQ